MNSPDNICKKFSSKKDIRLNIFIKAGMVVIEGNRNSLKFLSELIQAQGNDKSECHNHIAPGGAGSVFFKKKTGLGLYLHKLENDGKCVSEKIYKKSRKSA